MPLGSSSEAPVTNPGPRARKADRTIPAQFRVPLLVRVRFMLRKWLSDIGDEMDGGEEVAPAICALDDDMMVLQRGLCIDEFAERDTSWEDRPIL